MSQLNNKGIVHNHLEISDLVKIHTEEKLQPQIEEVNVKLLNLEAVPFASLSIRRHSKVVIGSSVSTCFTGNLSNFRSL